MKVILLRVGIDKGTDGCLAPIFKDKTFEYIPLSETDYSKENRTYMDCKGRFGRSLATYLPENIKRRKIHFDPEFETFTYGDKGSKAKWLLKLDPNDLLVFYAGLKPYNHNSFPESLYIIGYFTVLRVLKLDELNDDERIEYYKKCSNNAHIKRYNDFEDTVIVIGNENKSKLLENAILISEYRLNKIGRKYHAASKQMESLIGIKGSIQRSIPPRVISSSGFIFNLLKLINYLS